jgi:ElaB/YqjD/DUF883 family membrane-anchored ribosome-binding protein
MVSSVDGLSAAELRRQASTIKDDLSLLKSDLASMVRELVEGGKGEAGEARARLEAEIKTRIEHLEEAATHLADRARSTGKDAIASIEREAKDRPLQTLGIALGVGVLVGLILKR